MGLTLWLLDKQQKPRAAIRSGITELVHAEAAGVLTAEIPWSHAARSGEFLGLRCADGRDRLFEIQGIQEIEPEGIQRIDAQDAAWAELEKKIVVSAAIKNQKASAAMAALLAGTGWSLGTVSADGDVGNIADAVFEPVADAMERIADTAKVKLVPSYQLTGGKVTGRTIDMVSAEPVWRGRIINSRTASDIVLTEGEPPMGRVYALGGWTGTGSERQRVTINGVAWSKAEGDPVDKPAGQDWIDDPEYSAAYVREYVYTDQNATDPMQLAVDSWKDLEARRAATLIGTAKAGNVTFVEGWSHAQAQVDDLVGVRSKSGRAAQTRIAEIRRDHIFPERTQLEFGERQSRSWIQTQVARQEQQTRRMGGRMSAAEVVLEDTGVELYRAIEQIVELETGTATEFTEIWIDLDAVAGEMTTKASQELVDSLSGEVQTLSTEFVVAVDGIRATIQEGDETVSTLKATIDGLEHWVTDGAGSVAELTNTVNGLTATVTAADGRVGALAVTADGISASVQDQSGRLSQLAARIDEVAANVQDADGNIGQLSVRVDAVTATVTAADGRVGALAVTADGISASVQDQSGRLSQLAARIDEVAANVQDADGNIGQLSVRVDAVTQTVTAADGRVGALMVTADGIAASVQDQTGRMSELLVGLEEITAGVQDTEGAIGRLTVEANRIAGMMTDTSGRVTSLVEQTDKRFSAVVGDIELLEESVDQVTGSALWQTRESITAAVGKMRVDENGKLHIVEGSGLVIDSGGSSFGVYTQGNLTAGVIVDRINGGTVQIKAERVDLGEYATVTMLEAEAAKISNLTSGQTVATTLRSQLISAQTGFDYQGRQSSWKKRTVRGGVTLTKKTTQIPIFNAQGTLVQNVTVLTDVSASEDGEDLWLLTGSEL